MTDQEIYALKNQNLVGKNINLRIANPKDAAFILELRLNPLLNKFIGETDPNIENQKNWINNSYNKTNEFHFIIEDKNGLPFGTIALYDIDYKLGVAEWGRWVLKPGSPVYCSIESNVLVFHLAFDILKLKKLIGGANNENKKVVSFHKSYVSISSVTDKHTWFYVEDSNYKKFLKTFKDFHLIPIKNNIKIS